MSGARGHVQLELCDVLGQVVQDVHNGVLAVGAQRIALPAASLTSGIYFLRLPGSRPTAGGPGGGALSHWPVEWSGVQRLSSAALDISPEFLTRRTNFLINPVTF